MSLSVSLWLCAAHIHINICVRGPTEARREDQILLDGVIGSCEILDIDVGNRTQVLWKSSKSS